MAFKRKNPPVLEDRITAVARRDGQTRVSTSIDVFKPCPNPRLGFVSGVDITAGTGSMVSMLAALLAVRGITSTAPSLEFTRALEQSWGENSPWIPVATYVPPPLGCEIIQVNVLQRHGARYPEEAASKAIQDSIHKLKNATRFVDARFSFVATYKYNLGLDDLVEYGAQQSFDAGQEHFARYSSLVDDTMLPFVRSASTPRVVDSAGNWTAGFAYASNFADVPEISLIMPESVNDTLGDKTCPRFGASKDQTDAWMDVFTPPIVNRFNAAAPGANLNKSDIVNLMSLCSFDTVAHEAPSPWCGLFSTDEWAMYEYYSDLDSYYANGYGQEFGRAQGVGYVNELLARLTGTPVRDETQTNHTLDTSSITFPLDRAIYADFSHGSEMISILSAMGLFQQSPLDSMHLDPDRTWVVSRMAPFSARLVTEKLACEGVKDAYVRVLVNDAVQKLPLCGRDDGLCSLPIFLDTQTYARDNGEGDWGACFDKA